jgi:hypothetical protein
MVFKDMALKALGDYRKLVSRYVEKNEASVLLKKMDVARPRKSDSDMELMLTLIKIRTWLEEKIQSHPKGYYSYSGIEQYRLFLDEFLNQYQILSNRVVHKAQKASSAMLNIIQITGAPKASLGDETANRLINFCQELILFGSREQKLQVHALLNTKCEDYAVFFAPILQDYINFQKKQAFNALDEAAA